MILQTLTTVCAAGMIAVGSLNLGLPAASTVTSGAVPSETERGSAIAKGKTVFEIACSPCHGEDGAGDGPLAANFKTRPRDLTKGVYKSRSTASGQLPTDDDIDRAISAGIHTSTMPPYLNMTPDDRAAVVQYLKTLSPRFADTTEYPLEVLAFGQPIAPGPQGIARGREIYLTMQCNTCHGTFGKGDGVTSELQHDDFGNYVHTTDLTTLSDFRFAQNVQDVYRIFSTGLNGSPMPSYAGTLPDTDRWHLANYVWGLHGGER